MQANRALRTIISTAAIALALSGCTSFPPIASSESLRGEWHQDKRRLFFWVAPNGQYQGSLMLDDSRLGRAPVALSSTGLSLAYYIDRKRSCSFQVEFLDAATLHLLPDAGKTRLNKDCPVGIFVRGPV